MNAESNFNGVDANGISKVQRVTLHPRYSYFHFVGSYKPVTRHSDTYVNGEIVYEFVPGPIMECLVHALNSPDDDYLLILEEINRSETAAVFGDFFQLLDRKEDGTSAYPITVGTDVVQYLNNALTDSGKMTLRNLGGEINDLSNNGKILLPGNLHLWATMNSADQGVFPLDSAFKRRWSFRYVGIDDGAEHCPWNKERTLLNALLSVHAHCNEDKLIGPFFLPISIEPRLDDGTINPEFSETFANKVLMYLVEDVAKYSMNEIVDTKLLPLAPVLSDYLSAWRQDNFGIFAGIDSWNGFDSTSRAAGEIESEEDTLTNDPMSIG